jgi:hypothetical protein
VSRLPLVFATGPRSVRLFFNNLEEVKRARCLQASCDGLDCIDPFSLEFGEGGYRKHP